MKKIELLSPAGGLEKLKMALIYGADAVYLASKDFGLRAFADNFTNDEIIEGVSFAHSLGKKVYLAMNILAHNTDLEGMPELIKFASKVGIDAIIVSDPGVMNLVKEFAPEMEIHLSTQASTTNWKSSEFWHSQGAKRIVLARELTLSEISVVVGKTPETLEIETFVHGAMCISYSGRCLLSNYMTGRDANQGGCAHPCRYNYTVMEEQRTGEYYPVEEDERGTHIFNSRDLCMIRHIPELIEAGISSMKIEGRAKSAYYVATVTAVYRNAIDEYYKDPTNFIYKEEWFQELSKASHREYSTGFYFGKPNREGQVYDTSAYVRDCTFVGIVRGIDAGTGFAVVEQRNRMYQGENLEVLSPDGTWYNQKIETMLDENGQKIDVARHPQMKILMKTDKIVEPWSILRRPGEQ
ncbi:MAG: U32 family peptidase [Bacillota bacterium]